MAWRSPFVVAALLIAAPAALMPLTAAGGGPPDHVLQQGTFEGTNNHFAGGTVQTVHKANGDYVVRLLGDFYVQNGPELDVRVMLRNDPTETEMELADNPAATILRVPGYKVGGLQSTNGFQEYLLPADFSDLMTGSIVIYCETFEVSMALANL